jgi:hypothetical protein
MELMEKHIINLLLKKQGALMSEWQDAKENPDDLTDEEYFECDIYYETSIELITELITAIKEEEAKQ